jgi:endonuclease/exonuclease/phosphatase family metal-dependent hydrolase
VSWNVREVFEPDDLRGNEDMEAAARRLAYNLPRGADLILLQEVNGASAREIARLLSTLSKTKHEVVAAPPLSTHIMKTSPPHQTTRDTAIVTNSETMKKVGRVRWLSCSFDAEDADPEAQHLTTHQEPCVLVEHIPSQKRVVAVAAHFVQDQGIRDMPTENSYKAQWLRDIAGEIEKSLPPGPKRVASIIGGDLNVDRTPGYPEKVKGKERDFWKVMTKDMGYVDAVFEMNSESDEMLQAQYRRGSRPAGKRIDYIFIKGTVTAASHDLDYDPPEGSPGWATDHRLVWAEISLRPVQADLE